MPDPTPPPPRVSFCTTCANRAYQLKQTFAANAAVVARHPEVEWVIVNFASRDDLDPFLRSELERASPRLVYARLREERPWHVSVAKNAAHRLARGAFLVNLDCDNFIGDAADVVRDYTARGARLVHLWSGLHQDGTYGRIGLVRELFHALGGYDEAFQPMGYQDTDLLQRASASAVPILRRPCDSRLAIPNTKAESVKYCADGRAWKDYDAMNMARSLANLAAGRLRANEDPPWAALRLEVFAGGQPAGSPGGFRDLA